jgi:hypothetical protein
MRFRDIHWIALVLGLVGLYGLYHFWSSVTWQDRLVTALASGYLVIAAWRSIAGSMNEEQGQ